MNQFKQAYLALVRRPTRTLSLIAILMISSIMIISSFSVLSSISSVKEEIISRLPPTVLVEQDAEKLENDKNNRKLNNESILDLNFNPYLVVDFAKIQHEEINAYGLKLTLPIEAQDVYRHIIGDEKSKLPFFSIVGSRYPEFEVENLYASKLISGTYFEGDKDFTNTSIPIIISQDLANKNELNVGSIFEVQDNINIEIEGSLSSEKVYKEKYTFIVTGILEYTVEKNSKVDYQKDFEAMNLIIIPEETILSMSKKRMEGVIEKYDGLIPLELEDQLIYNVSPYFSLKKSTYIGSFSKAFNEFNSDPMIKLFSQEDNYSKIAEPLSMLNQIVSVFAIIVIIGSVLLIVSSLTNDFKHREKEVGIYRALGQKNSHLFIRFYLELLIPFIVSFALSVVFSILVSQFMTDLVKTNLTAGTVIASKSASLFSSISYKDIMSVYSIKIDFNSLIYAFTAAFIVITISYIFLYLKVRRYNPRDILL